MGKKFFTALTVLTASAVCLSFSASVRAESYIFYSNHNDSGRLYRINSDSSGLTRLSMHTANDIEVLGDWVYYYNDSETGGVFRTKSDGSVTERLLDSSEADCYGIYKDNGHIYAAYIGNSSSSAGVSLMTSELAIYDKNGYFDTIVIDNGYSADDLARYIEAEDNWLYFENTGLAGKSYYCFYIDYDNYDDSSISFKPLSNLPADIISKSSQISAGVTGSGFYREKYLHWDSVEGAEKYIVYVLNESTGKYKKLGETKGTQATLTVLDSQYNAAYMVGAVKNGKSYKVALTDKRLSLGNEQGNASNSPFTVSENGVTYIVLSDGIYSYDPSSGSKKCIFSGSGVTCLNAYNGRLFFAYRNHIYQMKTDGTGLAVMTSIYRAMGYSDGISSTNFSATAVDVKSMTLCGSNLLVSLTANSSSYPRILLLKSDDSSCSQLRERQAVQSAAINNKYIFMGKDSRLYSLNTSTRDEYCISENPVNGYSCYNGTLYYSCDDGLYAAGPDGAGAKLIYNSPCKDVNVYNGYVFFTRKVISEGDKRNQETEYVICKVKTDGSGYKELCSCPEEPAALNITADRIYCRLTSGKIITCNTEGNFSKELT